MHRPKPNKLHDDLDALLDGRPVELTVELAPLVEAAGVLRAELAAFQLDPEVADRHLERVLEGSATVVPMPLRQQANGWDLRRRVAAVALAAALVLAPATMASAAALPGQAMYPFKLAIEQLRVASVAWSPAREAGERTRVADQRLEELDRLVQLKMFNQVLPAIRALNRAVVAAAEAVKDAEAEGAPVGGVENRLIKVMGDGKAAVRRAASTVLAQQLPMVSKGTRSAIQLAVQESEDVLAQPGQVPSAGTPTPTPSANPPAGPPPSGAPSEPQPSVSTPPADPPTTSPPTTSAPTTTSPPPTSDPPPTADTGATPGSAGGSPPAGGEQSGADGRSLEAAPPTTSGP